jgi:hypothetical protein
VVKQNALYLYVLLYIPEMYNLYNVLCFAIIRYKSAECLISVLELGRIAAFPFHKVKCPSLEKGRI